MVTDQHIRPIEVIAQEIQAYYDQEIVPDDDVLLEWARRLHGAAQELRFQQFK